MLLDIEGTTVESMHHPVLVKLQRSSTAFYLTGSRFFGNHREDSDIDFFVQHHDNLDTFLESLGFGLKVDGETNYSLEDRPYCNSLLIFECAEYEPKIQIVSKQSLAREIVIRDMINHTFKDFHTEAENEDRMVMWDSLNRWLGASSDNDTPPWLLK